ncbi:MAG: TonB family protein [Xanthomonadaceae bacterium]|nr:TonB family protein [Xanthomonadaceae bacterium]
MSCAQGRNKRWLIGILSAVGVNLFLLIAIALFFQPQNLPHRVQPLNSVPVWQVEHLKDEPEPQLNKEVEPIKKTVVLPPVQLESLPLPEKETLPPIELPPVNLDISPQITGLVALSPLTLTEKSFYQPGELDQQPLPMATPAPFYPHRARIRGIEGKVRVRFIVNQQGLVKEIEIIRAEPEGYFEQSVKTALANWHFRPGTVANDKVMTQVETTIVFKLDQ